MKRFLQTLLLGLITTPLINPIQADEPATPDPVALMQRSIDALKQAKSYQFTSEYTYDVTQPDSQKLEFASYRQVSVERPNKIHIAFQKRSGESGDIYLDGKNITLSSDTHKVFAQTSQPGDTGQAITYMAERLDIALPLSDFFMPHPEKSLLESLTDSAYISTDIINGLRAHNLAFRKEHVDFQVWLSDEDTPKLLRIIITYKQHKGIPSFRANLTNWVFNAEYESSTFTPSIPKEYEQIPMLALKKPDQTEAGAVQ